MAKMLFRSVVACILLFLCSALSAQDIGLVAGEDRYISLNYSGITPDNQRMYSGHVTTFDASRGFVHRKTLGFLDQSGSQMNLEMQDNPGPFASLSNAYVRSSVDGNTAWQAPDACPYCNLLGTTFRRDAGALEYLRQYERNLSTSSLEPRDYLSFSAASQVFCKAGFTQFCNQAPSVGVVMDNSQVGALKIVASALGADSSIATFSSSDSFSAMVVTEPKVLSAAFRSVGTNLSDGVLDFNEWRVVPAAMSVPKGFHKVRIEVTHDPEFFGDILDRSRAISEINKKMKDFFLELTEDADSCSYNYVDYTPTIECFLHSGLLPINFNSVWVRAYCSAVLRRSQNGIVGDLFFVFERKFDAKSRKPDPSLYTDINYDDLNEALLAQSATNYIANKLQAYFETRISVGR